MREGLIAVPKFDNSGNSLAFLAESLMASLAKHFGGVTVIDAIGCWVDPQTGKLYREPVTQVITAYDPSCPAHDDFLRGAAKQIGEAGEQLAMYVRYASGEVEIIDTRRPATAKQAA